MSPEEQLIIINGEKKNEKYRELVLKTVRDQHTELRALHGVFVLCICGRKIRILNSYKCFYCHVRFCRSCAKKHFDQGDH